MLRLEGERTISNPSESSSPEISVNLELPLLMFEYSHPQNKTAQLENFILDNTKTIDRNLVAMGITILKSAIEKPKTKRHLLRVAGIIAAQEHDTDKIVATLQSTSLRNKTMTPDALTFLFEENIYSHVEALTRNQNEGKKEYLERIRTKGLGTIMAAKMIDRILYPLFFTATSGKLGKIEEEAEIACGNDPRSMKQIHMATDLVRYFKMGNSLLDS